MLKPQEDAVGQAFSDCLRDRGTNTREIIEFKDGKVSYSGGPEAYLKSFEDWDNNEKRSVHWIKPEVLDIGCGAGRFLLYLQQQNIAATGIDISPLCVRICEERKLQHVYNESLETLDTSKQFASILMMGNNLGMIGSLGRIPWFFRKIDALLTEGGVLIANGHNMDQQIEIRVRYEHYRTPWMDWLLISEETLQMHASRHGFRVLETYRNSDNSNIVFIIGRT